MGMMCVYVLFGGGLGFERKRSGMNSQANEKKKKVRLTGGRYK